jgi:hypothetical protein
MTPRCANSRGRDRTGLEFDMTNATCSVADCDKPHNSHGLCGMHGARLRRTGSVHSVRKQQGENHPQWRGDQVAYGGAHRRVYRTRGKAAAYTCECGSRAQQWAYDRMDADERLEITPGGPRSYSTDPDHYVPLCVPCHKRFDLAHLAGTT